MKKIKNIIPYIIVIPLFFYIIHYFESSSKGELDSTILLSIMALFISTMTMLYNIQRDTTKDINERKPEIICDFNEYIETTHDFDKKINHSLLSLYISNLGFHAKNIELIIKNKNSKDSFETIKFLKKEESRELKIVNKVFNSEPEEILIKYKSLNGEKYSTSYKLEIEQYEVFDVCEVTILKYKVHEI